MGCIAGEPCGRRSRGIRRCEQGAFGACGWGSRADGPGDPGACISGEEAGISDLLWLPIVERLSGGNADPGCSKRDGNDRGAPEDGRYRRKLKTIPGMRWRFEAGSLLAQAGGRDTNGGDSSHHQAVQEPGQQLKITGHSSDGIIESVEWTGDANWVVGVQWHPERMR